MPDYNPNDVVIIQRNSNDTSFVERVLTSVPNGIITFDSASNVTTTNFVSTASFSHLSSTSSFSITSNYSETSLTSSFSENSISASYAPQTNQFPDITDDTSSQLIGINQPTPQYTLDINGVITNSQQYGPYFFNDGQTIDLNGGYNSWVCGDGGNFGICNVLPNFTLDVYGSIGNSYGDLNLFGGSSFSEYAGNVNIYANNTQGPGGSIGINAGQGYSSAGTITLVAAPGENHDGGTVTFYSGDSNNNGGNIYLRAGNTIDNIGSYNGGSIYLLAGTGSQGNNFGGNIILISGTGGNGNGNVGINQGSPQFALDTSGDINFTGVLRYNGNPFTASTANTASYVKNAISASYAPSPNFVSGSLYASSSISSSWASSSISASYSPTSSFGGYFTANTITSSAILINGTSNTPLNVVETLDGFLQINIQNTTGSVNASSDIVATNNIGNNNSYYVDLGINSNNYNAGFVGLSNDGYLYNTGSNFFIGNATPNKNLYFFAGGVNNTSSLILDYNGNLSGSYFTGTSSYAKSSSYAITSSYATTSSYTITSSYATTSSYAVSASALNSTASIYSAAYILTGSYTTTKTSFYLIQPIDNGTLIQVNVSTKVYMGVPTGLPQGFACSFLQLGTGQLMVTGSAGVNVYNRSSLSSSHAQYSIISLMQIAANTYILQGDIG